MPKFLSARLDLREGQDLSWSRRAGTTRKGWDPAQERAGTPPREGLTPQGRAETPQERAGIPPGWAEDLQPDVDLDLSDFLS